MFMCLQVFFLSCDNHVIQVLNWKLHHNVVTVNTWVNTYMQLGSRHLRPPRVKAKEFEFPAYSCVEFTRVMKLLDLCSLDIASRQFGSSVLAASAVYLQSERSRADLAAITGKTHTFDGKFWLDILYHFRENEKSCRISCTVEHEISVECESIFQNP